MSAHFEIPSSILVDEDLVIGVAGLDPSLPVTLRASLQDDEGMQWRSWATFETDEDGQISTATSPAVDGTYRGAHAEGLLWSMVPASAQAALEHALKQGLTPTTVTLVAEQQGIASARGEIVLHWLAPGVVSQEVRSDGLIGTLFAPEGEGPFRAVLVFGGSDGGLRTDTAGLLASRGFLALALAYFRYPDLPAELVSIPLEYFQRAVAWLRREPRAEPDRGVGVVGRSRGGELALVLGATFAEVDAVVAYVPSGVVHAGIEAGERSWQVGCGQCSPDARGVSAVALGPPRRRVWHRRNCYPRSLSPPSTVRDLADRPRSERRHSGREIARTGADALRSGRRHVAVLTSVRAGRRPPRGGRIPSALQTSGLCRGGPPSYLSHAPRHCDQRAPPGGRSDLRIRWDSAGATPGRRGMPTGQ